MCWGLWSLRKRPNAVFPEREQEKKVALRNGNPTSIHQGVTMEPIFWILAPWDAQERAVELRTANGTWDDVQDLTRPGHKARRITTS